MTRPNIRTFLDLSTAHLDPSSEIYLAENSQAYREDPERWETWLCFDTGTGWFSWSGRGTEKPALMPASLWLCLYYAALHGCAYVMFDPDAPEQPPAEPPVLQWEAPRASGFSNIAGLYVMGIPEQARQAIIDAHAAAGVTFISASTVTLDGADR